jgi:hypothetical protein
MPTAGERWMATFSKTFKVRFGLLKNENRFFLSLSGPRGKKLIGPVSRTHPTAVLKNASRHFVIQKTAAPCYADPLHNIIYRFVFGFLKSKKSYLKLENRPVAEIQLHFRYLLSRVHRY